MRTHTRYLVVGYSRSGTTATHLALMGHPQVCALNDELRPTPFFTHGLSAFTGGNDTAAEKRQGFGVLFDALTGINATPTTRARGAKTACNSPRLAQRIVEVLQRHLADVKVIHVVRRDLVAQYGSGLSARRTGVMHAWDQGAGSRRAGRVTVRRWPFRAYALGCLRMTAVLRSLSRTHDVLELPYERYLTDPGAAHDMLFEFIGVDKMPAHWLTAKKIMPPPQDYISNYHAMCRELAMLERQVDAGAVPRSVELGARITARLLHTFGAVHRRRQRWAAERRRLGAAPSTAAQADHRAAPTGVQSDVAQAGPRARR